MNEERLDKAVKLRKLIKQYTEALCSVDDILAAAANLKEEREPGNIFISSFGVKFDNRVFDIPKSIGMEVFGGVRKNIASKLVTATTEFEAL